MSFSSLSCYRLLLASALTITAAAVFCRLAPAAPPAPSYAEVARFSIAGDGGWDYLNCDPASHRLFITRGSHVQVVDANDGKLLGDIPGTTGCHGVALAFEFKRGFVSDGGDNTVTIFDTDTLKTIKTVPVGQRPDSIIYDPSTKRVFTFNGGSDDSTAIDAATGNVVGTVALGGRPEFGATDRAGRIFVNLEDKSELLTIDPKALTITATTPLAPAEGPSGLACDPKTGLLYSACDNNMAAVVDGKTGKLVATPPIGAGPDASAVDSAAGLAFTSNGEDGTITILQQTGPGVFATETIPTERGARTMTLDPKSHRIYVVTAKFEAPAADAAPANGRRQRRKMVPGSFTVIVYAPKGK